jgi:hypothetical protein
MVKITHIPQYSPKIEEEEEENVTPKQDEPLCHHLHGLHHKLHMRAEYSILVSPVFVYFRKSLQRLFPTTQRPDNRRRPVVRFTLGILRRTATAGCQHHAMRDLALS